MRTSYPIADLQLVLIYFRAILQSIHYSVVSFQAIFSHSALNRGLKKIGKETLIGKCLLNPGDYQNLNLEPTGRMLRDLLLRIGIRAALKYPRRN